MIFNDGCVNAIIALKNAWMQYMICNGGPKALNLILTSFSFLFHLSFPAAKHVTCGPCAAFVCPESQPPTCHSPDLSSQVTKERGGEGEAG